MPNKSSNSWVCISFEDSGSLSGPVVEGTGKCLLDMFSSCSTLLNHLPVSSVLVSVNLEK